MNQGEQIKPVEIALFLIPVLGLVTIKLVGELYLSEILIALFWILDGRAKRETLLLLRGPAVVFVLGVVAWFVSQAATDLIRDTIFVDLVRGWSKIALFLALCLMLLGLLNSERKLLFWLCGVAVVTIIRPFQSFGDGESFANYWKFGVGYGIALLLTTYSFYRSFSTPSRSIILAIPILAFMVCGIFSFFFNARSVAAISLVSGILLSINYYYSLSNRRIPYFIVTFALCMSAFAISQIYSAGASSGAFGVEAQTKYDSQVQGGGLFSLVAGGRAEGLVSTIAIRDSPIIGHGSWAKDPYYTALLYRIRVEMGARDTDNMQSVYADEGLIPSHSYLFGSWVEAGAMGGLFWFAVFIYFACVVLPKVLYGISVLDKYLVIATPFFMWAIIFSPFGSTARLESALIIALGLRAIIVRRMVLNTI